MSPAFPARRRADEFERLVEAARNADDDAAPASSAAREVADLVALVGELREVTPPAPRPEFVADLRERLMTAAATELTEAARQAEERNDRLTVRRLSDPTKAGRRRRRMAVGIAALVIVGGTTGTALASQNALPGDTLYPVKRAVENLRTGLSISDHAKGTQLLGDAGTRLEEVRELAESIAQTTPGGTADSHDAASMEQTLEAFSSQATKGSDLLLDDYRAHQDASSIKALHTFTSDGIDQLAQLEPVVPDDAKDALGDAAQTLLSIDQTAASLCAECGSAITELPASLVGALDLDGLPDSGSNSDDTTADGPADTPTDQPSLPTVDPSSLSPGSVTGDSSDSSTSTPGSTTSTGTSTKTGKSGNKSTSTSKSSSSSDSSSGASSNSSTGSTLGDTVDGVTDGVTGLLSGVLGGLLGGS
ncbi:MAG: DUF5667 domain-containing protein [Nocardioides sp.]|uniref:DUF5667 domain-containing protein n=1 Tax=Nocardioides sp. TaxID=35761 RepID=UPI0039E65135